MVKVIWTLVLALAAMVSILPTATTTECPVYLANDDDIIWMDTEQRGPGGGWDFEDKQAWYGGTGYMSYKPWSSYGGVEDKPRKMSDERIKTYWFKVGRDGEYRFVIRSSAPHKTEHNDMWVSFPESGAVRFRHGQEAGLSWGKSLNDLEQDWVNADMWFKVYQNRGGNVWDIGGKTVDHEGWSIKSRTLYADGTWYSVRMAGRSTQFKVDRLVLYRCEGGECYDGSNRFKMATDSSDRAQSECETVQEASQRVMPTLNAAPAAGRRSAPSPYPLPNMRLNRAGRQAVRAVKAVKAMKVEERI